MYFDLFQKKTLWQSLHEWSALVDQWAECPFELIDAEQVCPLKGDKRSKKKRKEEKQEKRKKITKQKRTVVII